MEHLRSQIPEYSARYWELRIIHQPQVAILGVGAVVKRAVVIDDQIVVRPMSYFSLSYDHRALDGATADQFLAFVKNILEKECPTPN